MAVGLLLFVGTPSAEAAAPIWNLQMGHSPASFERLEPEVHYGVQFTVSVENSGNEVTAGTYLLDDVLPPQLTVAEISPGSGWTCTPTAQVIGGAPLSCSSSEVLAPGMSALAVTVLLNMSNSAPDLLSNEATISGGGAVGASAADPVSVVDRLPFSVQGFTARATTDVNSEYTVAGGHPYQVTTGFAIPLYTSAGEASPVEELNEAYVELPQGLSAVPRWRRGVLSRNCNRRFRYARRPRGWEPSTLGCTDASVSTRSTTWFPSGAIRLSSPSSSEASRRRCIWS